MKSLKAIVIVIFLVVLSSLTSCTDLNDKLLQERKTEQINEEQGESNINKDEIKETDI